MNFTKAALSMALVAAFAACSDDSSSKGADPIPGGDVPGDSTVVPVPGDSTVTPVPGDSIADTTANVVDTGFVMPVVPALTPTTYSEKSFVLDNFEDGDNQSMLNTWWYAYDDTDNGGASVFSTPLCEDELCPGADATGNKVFAIKFTTNKGELTYDPYVGWGVTMPKAKDSTAIDWSHIGGIAYDYIGAKHNFQIETSDVKDYDYHLSTQKASAATWVHVVVRFDELAQGGWGEFVDFNKNNISAISFQVKGKANGFVLFDNITLLDTADLPAPVADLTINPPAEPALDTIGSIEISNPLQAKAMKYLDKGLNITNWLEQNRFTGFEFDESDVQLMGTSGFKSLRLPIDLDQYVDNKKEYLADTTLATPIAINDTLYMILDSFANWTAKYGMSLDIDYHEYDNTYSNISAKTLVQRTMMAELWKAVAAHFATSEREDIFYELLNEPGMNCNGKIGQADWTATAQQIIDSIRTVDKNHTILFGDVQWYDADKLIKRTPFTDNNIIYVIHNYEPMIFTHQGASWTDFAAVKNIPFPYDTATWSVYSVDFGKPGNLVSWAKTQFNTYNKLGTKNYIMNSIIPAKRWAVTNNVPLIINEFGSYKLKTDLQSRLNYYNTLREISEELQIPLTHWGYDDGGFDLFADGKLIDGIAEALGLGTAAEAAP